MHGVLAIHPPIQRPATAHISVTVGTLLTIRDQAFSLCITVLRAPMAPVADTLFTDPEDVLEEVNSSKPGEGSTVVALNSREYLQCIFSPCPIYMDEWPWEYLYALTRQLRD